MRNQVVILALLTFLTIVLTPLPLNLWMSLSTAQVLAQTSSEKKAKLFLEAARQVKKPELEVAALVFLADIYRALGEYDRC